MQEKLRDPGNDDGIHPTKGRNRRKVYRALKVVIPLISAIPAVLGIFALVIGDPPQVIITAPPTGPGATATPCSIVRGTATLAEGTVLLVAVRLAGGSPRGRTAQFYNVDTPRASGPWDVAVSLDADNPAMAGQWYTISTLIVQAPWVDFLEKADDTADGPLTAAPAMPPHEGDTPSIDVQRGPGKGSC